jgi:hypothetical protein
VSGVGARRRYRVTIWTIGNPLRFNGFARHVIGKRIATGEAGLPIYSPITDRYVGQMQSFEARPQQPQNVSRETPPNLIPCYHVKMHCPKDGYYNLRVKDQPTYLATSCSHCKRPAKVIEYCQGYASPGSPVFTKGQQVISVEGYDIETRWVKMDGSRVKPKKNWGVARS